MPTAPILTLGARWKAEDVYWYTSHANAKLLGVNRAGVTGPVANFAHQSGIYVLYANFVPVYVGQANKTLWARLHQHMSHDDLAERWDRFTASARSLAATPSAIALLARVRKATNAARRDV